MANELPKPSSSLTLKSSLSGEDGPSDLAARLGEPGKYPFTRGIHKEMYRDRLWTMRQYAGFGSAGETNKRYRYLLSQGTTGLSVAFDLPTQMGRDPDHVRSKGEVGRVGVSISTLDDMRTLFDGIPLEDVSVSMTINATAPILLALYLVLAEERGVPWNKLRGTVQNDILKEYIARGTYIYPPQGGLRLVKDLVTFCTAQVPQWNTLSISGYHIREAGSTAADEVAFTLADGIAYVETVREAGIPVDSFAPRLSFFFNAHINFLEEIAKFRAARKLWASIMKERFQAKDPKSMMLRFHSQTAGSSLTAQQPLNNVVRTTIEAMSAVFGGTQSLHTNGFDEALGLPTEESATLALRTQQVIAYESGITAVADPLAGSYVIEKWTAELEELAKKQIAKIDDLGGMIRAIEERYPQKCIEDAAFEAQRQVEQGKNTVVGINAFNESNFSPPPIQGIDPEKEREQVEKLKQYKALRDSKRLEGVLNELAMTAKSGGNIMPPIIEGIRTRASLGEIADVLRKVFGEHREG